MCGLKHAPNGGKRNAIEVTPYVGVWIETLISAICRKVRGVTPYVGVWIETFIIRFRTVPQ